ncbi:MAG: glucose-1-phosphate adenylyltransferase [Deltaproteobacteria bacterium]|nr:glucose-1-phosphate adenylyltransferase [Deltaproteobacteria bacterium]
MRKTVAMVFAGGRTEEMSVLTMRRPKAAVVFGGSYRMIDFALTNLANTKAVENVGILTQYRPSSLVDHVGIGLAWDFVGSRRGVRFLPPYLGPEHSDWYRGTADALYQNLDFLDLHQPDDVLIVSGDHAYQMDYTALLRFHEEHAAEVTLAFTPATKDPSRFGIAELNTEGRIVNYMEKPEHPRTNLASMTVYAFRRDVLVDELKRHAAGGEAPKSFQIYDEILPRMMARRRAYGFVHHGPWEYTRTLDTYFEAHQAMLGDTPALDLAAWKVRTNVMARRAAPPPPTHQFPGAVVNDSILSGGCRIAGHVERSVLSPDVSIAKGAVVKRSILWDGVEVQAGAVLEDVICDKRCVIGAGARIGAAGALVPNAHHPKSLTCGATVLGTDVHVPPGAEIGKNCIVFPRAGKAQLGHSVASGTTVSMPLSWYGEGKP